MALQDIINAIISDADGRIAEIQSAHKQAMSAMREQGDKALAKKRADLTAQKEQKKRQMKERAESHARAQRNQSVLAKKQEHLDALYDDVLKQLAAMPEAKLHGFLEKCLGQLEGKGVIHPAKGHEAAVKKLAKDHDVGAAIPSAGGFRFVGDKHEQDFTFEFLIREVLRPKTEMKTVHSLFTSSR